MYTISGGIASCLDHVAQLSRHVPIESLTGDLERKPVLWLVEVTYNHGDELGR